MNKLLILLCLMMTGCPSNKSEGPKPVIPEMHCEKFRMPWTNGRFMICRTPDGTTCYIYSGFNSGGVDCKKNGK